MTVDWTGITWTPEKGYNLPVDDQQLELFIEPEKLGIDVQKKVDKLYKDAIISIVVEK
tara:strand:- start:64 stop:237 length:174 start_codon:yes stop_codon:yes gene_type:complete